MKIFYAFSRKEMLMMILKQLSAICSNNYKKENFLR